MKDKASVQKIDMFDSSGDEGPVETVEKAGPKPKEAKMKVNEKYEKKFNAEQKRQQEEEIKLKYGKNLEYFEAVDEFDSDLSEDEEAKLDNELVNMKFMDTIMKIRNKDPTIYDPTKNFFDEGDFEAQNPHFTPKQKAETPFTYKDQLRQAVQAKLQNPSGDADSELSFDSNHNSDDETLGKRKKKNPSAIETPNDEAKRIKSEFKVAAKKNSVSANPEDSGSDDDFLKVRGKKSKNVIDSENQEFENFRSVKENSKKFKDNVRDNQNFEQVFGSEKKGLSDKDKFLRKFIISKGWECRSSDDDDNSDGEGDKMMDPNSGRNCQEVDAMDEEHLEKVDQFETGYNFRQEIAGESYGITTFGRETEGTLRRNEKSEKRRQKRLERIARKLDEKEEVRKETEVVKTYQKEKILDKLAKLKEMSGHLATFSGPKSAKGQSSGLENNFEKVLEGDWDPEAFDANMNDIYDEDYYEREEEDIDGMKDYLDRLENDVDKNFADADPEVYEEDRAKPLKGNKKTLDEITVKTLDVKTGVPVQMKPALNKEEAQEIADAKGGENIWWLCDGCDEAILPLQPRYDCCECPNYTLCKKCADMRIHDHKMKKLFVPDGCKPPEEDQLQEIKSKLKTCELCETRLDGRSSYYRLIENTEYIVCELCMTYTQKTKKNKTKISDFEKIQGTEIDLEGITQNEEFYKLKGQGSSGNDQELIKLIDDYYDVDFEDVIGGGIKCRFKYGEVDENDFHLDDETILFADDKILNQMLSIKKLAPYKTGQFDDKKTRMKLKKFRTLVRQSADKNKEKFMAEMKLNEEEEELKVLAKKSKKYQKKLEQFREEKAERVKLIRKSGGVDKREKLIIRDMTGAKDGDGVEGEMDGQNVPVSDARLKAYGLK
jgi:protein KRI1